MQNLSTIGRIISKNIRTLSVLVVAYMIVLSFTVISVITGSNTALFFILPALFTIHTTAVAIVALMTKQYLQKKQALSYQRLLKDIPPTFYRLFPSSLLKWGVILSFSIILPVFFLSPVMFGFIPDSLASLITALLFSASCVFGGVIFSYLLLKFSLLEYISIYTNSSFYHAYNTSKSLTYGYKLSLFGSFALLFLPVAIYILFTSLFRFTMMHPPLWEVALMSGYSGAIILFFSLITAVLWFTKPKIAN